VSNMTLQNDLHKFITQCHRDRRRTPTTFSGIPLKRL
jgi:hypothetical protein